MPDIHLILLLVAQTAADTQAVPAGPPIPTWGWITIVAALGSTVATLAGFTWRAMKMVTEAKNETIKRADEEQVRTDDNTKLLTDLLERAIKAFETSKNTADQQIEKHNQYIAEMKELKEEVRRVGEKLNA